MSTTFVLHDFGPEHVSDGLVTWPTFGYTSWDYKLVVSRREGASPTLDVTVQTAPVAGNEDLWENQKEFTQVTAGTSLPSTESSEETLGDDARYHRIDQQIVGRWWYKLTATVSLFDYSKSAHTDLLEPRITDYSGLVGLADQAEDDVVRRFTERQAIQHTTTIPNVSEHRMHARPLETTRGRLMLIADEDTGRALREAIARRVNWLFRRRELEKSAKPQDGPLLRQHFRKEWTETDAALSNHDDRTPLYAM